MHSRSQPLSPCKILVVEDNCLNTELVTDLLEADGFDVISANTAADGIRLARAENPELIIMDINLPDRDGLSVARELKDHADTRTIPIIALTAHAMKGDEQMFLDGGCDGYLSKPIDTRTFVAAVTSFIRPAKSVEVPPAVPTTYGNRHC